MRLIDANTAAAFAENCGANFVAKRLRDSNAFPEVVTRCKDCKYRDGTPGQPDIICYNMRDDDFCSCGEPKEGTHADDHD